MANRDLTEGPIPRHLVALAIPVVVATSLQSLYALTGLFWVGLLGEDAVAGLSIGLQVFFVILAISQVLATTALADLSQDWGAHRRQRAGGVLSAYLLIAAGVGLATAVVGWLGAGPYVAAFTDDPAVGEAGVAYFRAAAPTFCTQVVLLVAIQGLRAAGDFTTPVRVSVTTVTLNLLLDPVLMFGGAWPGDGAVSRVGEEVTRAVGLGQWGGFGIAGAGYATAICQAIGLLWFGGILYTGHNPLRLHRPLVSRELVRGIVVRGLPAGLQFLLLSAVLGVMLAAVKPFGSEWTAATGGGFRMVQQLILPIVATATAAAALAGQNAGAGRMDRVAEASRVALTGILAYAVVGTVVISIGASTFGRLFAGGPELAASETYFRWTAPALLGFATSLVPAFVLQALKRPGLPLLAALVRIVVLAGVALVVVPRVGAGPEWVFAAFTVGCWLEGVADLALLWLVLRDSGQDPLRRPAEATAGPAAGTTPGHGSDGPTTGELPADRSTGAPQAGA